MRCFSLLISLFFVSACPQPDIDNPWDEYDDDDAANDDDAATDDDDDEPQLGPGGSIGIWYWELPPPDPADGVMIGAGFVGNFWEDLVPGVPGKPVNGPYDWEGPDGLDDCALNVYDEADMEYTEGTPGVSEERDAGVITLESPNWSVDIEPWATTTQGSQYYFELDPYYEVHFDTFYDITVEGATFPAFDSFAELLVPDAIHLVYPVQAEQFELGAADFDIEWEGGSLDQIWIELHHGSMLEFGNASITCVADNDGAFSIPAAMIAQLPAGELLNLSISQPRNVTVVVEDIEVDVGSAASATANGTRP
jgi:hypothetical protein